MINLRTVIIMIDCLDDILYIVSNYQKTIEELCDMNGLNPPDSKNIDEFNKRIDRMKRFSGLSVKIQDKDNES